MSTISLPQEYNAIDLMRQFTALLQVTQLAAAFLSKQKEEKEMQEQEKEVKQGRTIQQYQIDLFDRDQVQTIGVRPYDLCSEVVAKLRAFVDPALLEWSTFFDIDTNKPLLQQDCVWSEYLTKKRELGTDRAMVAQRGRIKITIANVDDVSMDSFHLNSVSPDQTIGSLQESILEQILLAKDNHCPFVLLFCEFKVLSPANSRKTVQTTDTLFNAGLCKKNATLMIQFPGKVEDRKNVIVQFKCFAGETHTLTLRRDSDIKSIKSQLNDLMYPKQVNEIIHHSGIMHDDDTLASKNILSHSILHVTLVSSDVARDFADVGLYNCSSSSSASTIKLPAKEVNASDGTKVCGDGSMRILIKTLSGKTCPLMVEADYTIDDLQALIEQSEGIPVLQQGLVFGQPLAQGRTLSSYNIRSESTIHLVLKLKGGMLTYCSGRQQIEYLVVTQEEYMQPLKALQSFPLLKEQEFGTMKTYQVEAFLIRARSLLLKIKQLIAEGRIRSGSKLPPL